MTKRRTPALIKVVYYDLKRQLLNLFLFLAVVTTAMTVIYIAHLNRNLTSERDELLSHRDQLDREWRHLTIEQNVLTEHSRVERLAQEQLDMRKPKPSDEVVVPWP
ncbi:cell division protein FtsL [Idiomarina tyrosinivorans]|uniref:Cell division protein FtsL n=1 Tax=Idiomarina tyrosinivorans TaxID=1445662 RepID=A0A432ZQB5_9GAMM|nr:cell division protein FtsL [Idiomarina tyrosinivorans]RUO80087.1 cell division protein FtsL [Idiomarina tyrosinivorans]